MLDEFLLPLRTECRAKGVQLGTERHRNEQVKFKSDNRFEVSFHFRLYQQGVAQLVFIENRNLVYFHVHVQ